MFSILYNFLQYRDDTIVKSELNEQNTHLADNGNRHKEVVDLYTSHIYAAINKRNENL